MPLRTAPQRYGQNQDWANTTDFGKQMCQFKRLNGDCARREGASMRVAIKVTDVRRIWVLVACLLYFGLSGI